MKKQWKNILSLALVLCLLVSAVPVSATAVEETPAARSAESQSGGKPAAAPAVTEQEEVTVIREEESLRGEYEKHFLMSDGTYQAVVYSQPVHELVDGVWVEIEATNPNARGDVTTDSTKSNIIDNYVLKGYGVQNKSLDRLYIGNRSAGLTRAYIQFAAMPTIPAGATITAATMTLHFTSGTNTAANASAYQVTGGEWASGTIQWSNKPAADVLLQSNISHNNVTGYVFSCLTAVRHWYDGDTTGQNENYGIMLRYYDESTDDYNAVYSADYSDATKRPSLTIYYQPVSSEVNMPVGKTRTLTVDDYAGTITWTSNNTSVATVNSSGVVTGIKVGTATITAYVGGIEYKTFTVRVTIADGVYRITNTAGLTLGTYGSIAENTRAKMLSYSDTGFEKLYQLWKIAYLGNGYYGIRPLHKLDMGLHAAGSMGSFVDIVSMGTNDTLGSVPSLCRWSISPTADGTSYFINHVGTNSLGMTMDGQVPIVGMDVITDISSETQGYFKWMLDRATDLPSGVKLYDTSTGYPVISPRTISVGETKSLSDLNLLPIGYSWGMNSTNFEWESEDETITVDQYTGAVTGVSVGAATITGRYCQNGTFYYVSYTINVSKLLIYQTKNTYYHDGNGNYAEDLVCGDLSENELRALEWVNWADFADETPEYHRASWEFMCTSFFAKGELETVILDMIDHFMDGSGTAYSNSVLTQKAYEHDTTQAYINQVKAQLGLLINAYDGDISGLAYSANTRDSNPLVLALKNHKIYQPVYNTDSDRENGLTICIDGLWGNKIEVSSYSVSDGSYSCKLHYTLYDHFGLDQADVEKYGYLGGFRSWYVLQHYSDYNSAYKPFLTMIEFDVTISGPI